MGIFVFDCLATTSAENLLPSSFSCWTAQRKHRKDVRSEDVPHQAQARQEAEAEPADPPVVQDAHRQHHPLQRQEAPLEEDQAQAVSQHRLWSRWEIFAVHNNGREETNTA